MLHFNWIFCFLCIFSEATITTDEAVAWLKLNKNQVGYYRVNYPTQMWEALSTSLQKSPEMFSAGDRAHLLSDAFALADAGQLDYSIPLNLTKYLSHELEYVPWTVAISRLIAIRNLLYNTEKFYEFNQFARQLLANVYKNVTWTIGDNHLEKYGVFYSIIICVLHQFSFNICILLQLITFISAKSIVCLW